MLSPTPTSAQPSFTPFSINKYFVTLVQTSVVDCQVQKKSEREHKMQSVKIVKGKSPWCVVEKGMREMLLLTGLPAYFASLSSTQLL
jgi:hypothetical protein